mmetsp:Transcript_250/g.813  ORF Transcript_250/g.813 Transcript_250/m.813 type:complete len:304 (-) Transcript_250:141-1052(-)|eukprot:CAMPEP_0117444372 /NCGR_PEP_ID=MMETSP0759-20121206/5207_1 /TAXON_ID=63605 /ORGANISM="Percolomonas cosmopolitus, Strain WS" /LENGTH=303 /DNA_ID=CAMNT_0005236437 /DNA_START=176 /DNA_END=1087 /DNA_ORIENTATION=+
MFHVNANQHGATFFTHNIRSAYDSYYYYTDPHGASIRPGKVRVLHWKEKPFGQSGVQDFSAFEVVNGRPTPPSFPFGTYAVKNVYTVDEWRQRGYKIVASVASVLTFSSFVANYWGETESIPRHRKWLVAKRRAFGWFSSLFLGGSVWVWYVARCKENSPAKHHYKINNKERAAVSVLMGLAIGAASPRNGSPWYGQFPRGSILFHFVKYITFWYAFVYGCMFDQWAYQWLTKLTFLRGAPASYNVTPWWLDTPSLPYDNFEATQRTRTFTWKETKNAPYEPIEMVDEYSPEHEFKKRYEYSI